MDGDWSRKLQEQLTGWMVLRGGWWVVTSDLEGFGIGCSEGGAGAGRVNGSSWGILLPVARVVLEFLYLPPGVLLSLRVFLHSKDGVRHVQIHTLSCAIPSLSPFFPFVIVIKKICSLLNRFPVRKWMYSRNALGILKSHLFVLLPLSYGQGRGWLDQRYSLKSQGSWVPAQRLQLAACPASRCEQGLGNCSFPSVQSHSCHVSGMV